MASSNGSREIGLFNFGTGVSGISTNIVIYIIGHLLPLPKEN